MVQSTIFYQVMYNVGGIKFRKQKNPDEGIWKFLTFHQKYHSTGSGIRTRDHASIQISNQLK